MNKRILKAIIANIVDHVHGSVTVNNAKSLNAVMYELQLDSKQAEVAIAVTDEVAKTHDWQFNDTDPDYNLHVVRQFILRHCDTDLNPEGEPELHLKGESLERFIITIHKELVS